MPSATLPSALLDKNHRRFVLRRLNSLLGVVPLGVFLVLHLFTNARAVLGEASYTAAVSSFQGTPYVLAFEIAFVLFPLSVHALYGVLLTFEGKTNVDRYPGNRNWMYTAQRVTGILAFAFIVWHVVQLWVPKIAGKIGPDQFYGVLIEKLSTPTYGVPLVALLYLFGTAATVFHFANGVWGFLASWGITPTRRSQRLSGAICGVLGVIVFLIGGHTAIFFATGSRLSLFDHPAPSSAPPAEGAPAK